MNILRPYQEKALRETRGAFASGSRSVCHVSPTGSGKTVFFTSLVDGASRKNKRCLITVHRAELLEQTSAGLVAVGVPHGVISPDYPETPESVQVASIDTLAHRLDRHGEYDLIVMDECHHAIAGKWRRVIDAMPQAKLLGVTATPERLDGRGLGDVFDTLVPGPTTAELIKAGYLAQFTYFAPAEPDLSDIATRAGDFAADQLSEVMARPVVVGSAVDAYTQHCAGKKAVVFGVDRLHSVMLAERFASSGYKAVHLDGDTPKAERRQMIKGLATGEIDIITNCGIVSEGLDVPTIEAVLLARPTQSLAMHLQQVGRVLRPSAGKGKAVILDLAGNVFRHGLPDAERKWSLDGKSRKQRDGRISPQLRSCERCGALNGPKSPTCTSCASLMAVEERREAEIELERIADLRKFEAIRSMNYEAATRWAGANRQRLRQVALAKGYRAGWVYRRLEELGEVA